MMYADINLIPKDEWAYKNFPLSEPNLACSHCGKFFHHVPSMQALQKMRDDLGRAISLNSGYRCPVRNAEVNGAKNSMHLKLAFDVSLTNHDRNAVYNAAKRAGFTGFGFYKSFLHIDMGLPRFWYGKGATPFWDFS